MTETLTRAKPRIEEPEELTRLVKRIVERVDPVAIYLFGSRARGCAKPGSDYDLLIVVQDDFPTGQADTVTTFSLVEGRRIPIDVAMTRATRFATRREQVGTVEYTVGREGALPYERRDRTAYLVQQAAEKLAKAALVSIGLDPPDVHDIADIIARLPADAPLRDQLAALSALTPYATGFRYPSFQEPPPLPPLEVIDGWIDQIEGLKADPERLLEQRRTQS